MIAALHWRQAFSPNFAVSPCHFELEKAATLHTCICLSCWACNTKEPNLSSTGTPHVLSLEPLPQRLPSHGMIHLPGCALFEGQPMISVPKWWAAQGDARLKAAKISKASLAEPWPCKPLAWIHVLRGNFESKQDHLLQASTVSKILAGTCRDYKIATSAIDPKLQRRDSWHVLIRFVLEYSGSVPFVDTLFSLSRVVSSSQP